MRDFVPRAILKLLFRRVAKNLNPKGVARRGNPEKEAFSKLKCYRAVKGKWILVSVRRVRWFYFGN